MSVSASPKGLEGDTLMGVIIGFSVFAIGYAYAVIYVAIDMKARYKYYEDLV